MGIVEFLYYLGFSAKRIYSLWNQKKLHYKVISIGNITTGGTGKTPATIAVAEEAGKRGFFPVILTRGYKGSAKGPCFVTRGNNPPLSVKKAGDEPVLMSERLKGVPIVKGSNRYESGMFAVQHLESKIENRRSNIIFILDDGFQHWRLYRDKDIVLVDSNNPFGNRKLLPLGRLREPERSLARAGVLVITKCRKDDVVHDKSVKNLINIIRQFNDRSPVFFSEHIPVSCRLPSGEKKPLSLVSNKKVFGFCAVASPESFMDTIKSIGAELVGFKKYRDHYTYRDSDILKIKDEAEKSGAEWIVTTEKDIIKIGNLDLPENILIIEIEFSIDDDFYREIFNFSRFTP